MSDMSDLAAIEASDDVMAWVGTQLGIVVLQGKNTDKIIATWVYEREIKNSSPIEFENLQITSTGTSRRAAIGRVIATIKELGDINLAIKLVPYRKQVELIKDMFGNNIIEDE